MIIPVHHITEQGYKITLNQEPWMSEAAQAALEGEIQQVSAAVSLTRDGQSVLADLAYKVQGTLACMRCAHEITVFLERKQRLHYEPMSQEHEEDLELDVDDLDIGWYEDGELDLAVVICEAITLDLPSVVHCECDFVTQKNPAGCLQENKIEERTLENLFVDLFKTQ